MAVTKLLFVRTIALGGATLLLGCEQGSDAPRGIAFPAAQFKGAGLQSAAASIAAGAPPVTCGLEGPMPGGSLGPAKGATAQQTCLYGEDPTLPAATVEWIVEAAEAAELVHVRLTLNPTFVDNSYGENAIGWPERGAGKPKKPAKLGAAPTLAPAPAAQEAKPTHTFGDLLGSDHAEFKLVDAAGQLTLHFKADYLSEAESASSGYASLGVIGGEGKMLLGSAEDVVAVSTSLERNLNVCGLGSYTESSPPTDASYAPSAQAPAWDYRVVYDVWVRKGAFGSVGFGRADVDFVHASPSKSALGNTLNVTPGACPDTWEPYCGKPTGCGPCSEGSEGSCASPESLCGETECQFI